MIGLIDCNNFYVSCERVFRPELENKPVVVLSNNDGCIISRSMEAKRLGIKMAEPVHKISSFLLQNGVEIFSSNYALYGDMSQRVMDTIREMVPEIEVYSIDEAFLNLKGIPDLDLFLAKLKAKVQRDTGIPVSIGAGATKSLAKIANKAAKNCDGIFLIDSNEKLRSVLLNTPIQDIWGVGRQFQKKLIAHNVLTASDFCDCDSAWVKKNMSVVGHRIQMELQGTECIGLEQMILPKKAIATTRSFGKKLTEIAPIREAISTHAVRCAEKLRKQKSVASLVTVFIHTDPFSGGQIYYKSQTVILPVPSNTNVVLLKAAIKALNVIFKEKLAYKKAGVIVEGLQSEDNIQGNLFESMPSKQNEILAELGDMINRKYGQDKLMLAAQGINKEWKLRHDKLSKRYTTNFNEIVNIKI